MNFLELWKQTLNRHVVFRYKNKPEWIYILAAPVDSQNISNRPGITSRAVLTIMDGQLGTVAIPLTLEDMEKFEGFGLSDWFKDEVEELQGIALCMGFSGLPKNNHEEKELIDKSIELSRELK